MTEPVLPSSELLSQTVTIPKKEILFHGVPASPGIAIGKILVVGGMKAKVDPDETKVIPENEVESEIALFQSALEKTKQDILELQKRVQESVEGKEASIFDAHLLIVQDRTLSTEVNNAIRNKRIPAAAAFSNTVQKYISVISSMGDAYLKERADDIRDVASRISDNIAGLDRQTLDTLPGPTIVVAHDLAPSDTIMLDRKNTLGFAIETGSRTSHTAILARAIKIPAVVGMQRITRRFESGDQVIIDGYLGMVILNPTRETIDFYRAKMAKQDELTRELMKESSLLGETLDGFRIQLCANVESISDVEDMIRFGGEGVGLFRTEFLFMRSAGIPDEESQFRTYSQFAQTVRGRNLVIRTIDIGGDKLEQSISAVREPNPFLGVRAIRLIREKPDLIRTQLRAILRASSGNNISILFPMVSSVEEVNQLLAMLSDIKQELTQKKIPFDHRIKVGVMIEIPSAALIADRLAEKVDFFSIGTNDLVQYTLAVDRLNEKVAYLYRPTHPAVLELIARTAKAAHKHHICVSVCGELAADPLFTPIFLGLGIHELSMSPASIGQIRRVIRRLKMHQAEKVAETALSSANCADPLRACKELLSEIAPDLVSGPV